MKNLVAVPCYNEEVSIESTLTKLLQKKQDLDYEVLVCNDGSIDNTKNLIKKYEDDIVILSSEFNEGLSEVFNSIIYYARENRFDSLLIFDADEQYPVEEIDNVFKIFFKHKYDLLIGGRQFNKIKHFSVLKKILQRSGSWFVSLFLKTKIFDCTSGFRMYSYKALNYVHSTNKFSYTIETLFQMDDRKFKMGIFQLSNVNKTRDSVLFDSNFGYLKKTFKILFKSIAIYKKKLYFRIYLLLIAPGLSLLYPFLSNYFEYGKNVGNVQSLTVGIVYLGSISIIYFLSRMFATSFINHLKIEKRLFSPKHTHTA
jgi:glycosyltransferase involved in cell wall biosynthesis